MKRVKAERPRFVDRGFLQPAPNALSAVWNARRMTSPAYRRRRDARTIGSAKTADDLAINLRDSTGSAHRGLAAIGSLFTLFGSVSKVAVVVAIASLYIPGWRRHRRAGAADGK